MPQVINCPLCQGTLTVDEAALGKKVRCPLCKGTFLAEAIQDVLPVEEADLTPPSPPPKAPPPPARAPQPFPWETLDSKPEKPRRRRRDEDDEDEDGEDDRRRGAMSHNGGLLHTLSFVALCISCIPALSLISAILAIVTILMARHDLNAMRRGDMDTKGRIQTGQAKARAITGLIVSLIVLFLSCMWVLYNLAHSRIR